MGRENIGKSMISNVTVVSSLFDYPEIYQPSFLKNALKTFSETDIQIVRNSGLITTGSYYDKLYFYKIPKMLEHIENNVKTKYMLFLDATDTNFYSSPIDIIEKFENFGCSILFGSEKGLWPPTDYTHLYQTKNITGEYKYLNSGTYFGYTSEIIRHMKNIIKSNLQNGIDDQGKWTIEYLISNDIKIDNDNILFFSTYKSKNVIKIKDGIPHIIDYNPIIVHDNGPHDAETEKIVKFL